MNTLTILFALFAALAVTSAEKERKFFDGDNSREEYEKKFFDWLIDFPELKPIDGEKYVYMLENFIANDKRIEATNAKNLPYKLGHNQFSHMSHEEFKAFIGLRPLPSPSDFNITLPKKIHDVSKDLSVTAATIDWSAGIPKTAVTVAQNQGACGSCYAFSGVEALEGMYAVKYGTVVSFSKQQSISCMKYGCNGGLPIYIWNYALQMGGICSEPSFYNAHPWSPQNPSPDQYYGYNTMTKGSQGSCYSCSVYPNTRPTAYVQVPENSDAALSSALNVAPVAIGVDASDPNLQLYKSGVWTANCVTYVPGNGCSLDHAIVAVGYGYDSSTGLNYWKAKNSWSASWGESGFIRLQKFGNPTYGPTGGSLGILQDSNYPVY